MTPVERLMKRLRTIPDVRLPETAEFHRIYAGTRQREAGAWSWEIVDNHVTVLASYASVTELLRAKRLAVVDPANSWAHYPEVYDADDVFIHDSTVRLEPV